MVIYTLVLSALAFQKPENRSSIGLVLILSYIFTGIIAGYSSARMYKMFQVK
jgi:transmembrane 9 superfamily protein 2/4